MQTIVGRGFAGLVHAVFAAIGGLAGTGNPPHPAQVGESSSAW
ncbi:hypothetical protein [Mycobacterium marinum]|nr:hypothetical protein [Mycobacterium marinum]